MLSVPARGSAHGGEAGAGGFVFAAEVRMNSSSSVLLLLAVVEHPELGAKLVPLRSFASTSVATFASDADAADGSGSGGASVHFVDPRNIAPEGSPEGGVTLWARRGAATARVAVVRVLAADVAAGLPLPRFIVDAV